MALIRTQDKSSILDILDWYGWVINKKHLCLIWSREIKKGFFGKREMVTETFSVGQFSTIKAAYDELDAIERWLEGGGQGVYQIGPDPKDCEKNDPRT